MSSCSVEVFHSFVDMPCWLKHCLIWVNQHQILLSGSAASIAAYITIRKIKEQITQTKELAKTEKVDETKSNALVMLSEYTELTNSVMNFFKNVKKQIPKGYTGPLFLSLIHI